MNKICRFHQLLYKHGWREAIRHIVEHMKDIPSGATSLPLLEILTLLNKEENIEKAYAQFQARMATCLSKEGESYE